MPHFFRIVSLAVVAMLAAWTVPVSASGPVKVWVSLKDKGPNAPAPSPAASSAGYLSPGSPVRAYEDLPVHAPYVDALRARGLAPGVRLKWQNRVSGYADMASLPALRALPFVASVSLMPRKAAAAPLPPAIPLPWRPRALAKRAAEGLDYGAGRALMESLRVDKVHAYMNATGMPPGRGVRVAVIDADFHLGNPIFAAMRGRIRDQYDFVDDKPVAVTNELRDSHGAQCMSLIGGNLPGTLVGGAPEAEFLLYRAEEDGPERYVEEDYVARAIERAVDSGAQVISISLGYRYDYSDGSPDLPYPQFDGRTRPSSLAALGAARRNVLVTAAVGNESGGEPPFPTVNAPADADSILAVGIVDPYRRRCGYSCTGPSADGRVKPDVVSMGTVGACNVATADPFSDAGDVTAPSGTSFAAPVIAGVAALLRQLRPALSAEEIRQAILASGDRSGRPDSLVGYGLVDAVAAANNIRIPVNPPFSETGLARIYHSGGGAPIFLAWDPNRPGPKLQMLDLSGRLIPVTVRASGALVIISPGRPLRSGIYIARVR